jgi:uncharacterized protein (DUF1330 family)
LGAKNPLGALNLYLCYTHFGAAIEMRRIVRQPLNGEYQMSAYVLVEIEVIDPVLYEEYKQLAPASIAQYGGKYVARGGKTATLEGDWSPTRLVVLEFESLERAKAWWNSPEYAAPKSMRQRAAKTNMVAIEGLPSA